MVALDLTNDHKPDLPEEKKRILAAGGTVTPAGPDGRPSRMYANGHVGLAMSRSLGDGLCKDYGCIPDPEIQHFSLKLPPKAGPQGEEVDSFLIVASDGVWEFITSQEACEIVSKCESASDAVENLVNEACARWRQFEGSYRDDITAIIVYLPFLDDGNEVAAPAGAAPAAASAASVRSSVGGEGKEDEDENAPLYINQGGVHGQATLASPPQPRLPQLRPALSAPPPPAPHPPPRLLAPRACRRRRLAPPRPAPPRPERETRKAPRPAHCSPDRPRRGTRGLSASIPTISSSAGSPSWGGSWATAATATRGPMAKTDAGGGAFRPREFRADPVAAMQPCLRRAARHSAAPSRPLASPRSVGETRGLVSCLLLSLR